MESVNHKYFDDTDTESKAETKSLRTSSSFSKIRKSKMHRSKSLLSSLLQAMVLWGYSRKELQKEVFVGVLDPPRDARVSSTHCFDTGWGNAESESSKSISRLPRSLSSPFLQKSRHAYNRAIGKDLSASSSGKRIACTENELRLLDSLLLGL